ncbi:uncharacterized protein CBL_03899 [Carabus blaptoides fortunei]
MEKFIIVTQGTEKQRFLHELFQFSDVTLDELLYNPIYSNEIKRRSAIMLDQPVKPLDNAIYWIEHVLRHKGGRHLYSVAAEDNATITNQCGKQVKGGYLLRHKRSWLMPIWCEEWVVLYEDSTMAWFKDKGTVNPRVRMQLSESPDLLAVGEWTCRVPKRPRMSSNIDVCQLMAFGNRQQGKVLWLMAQSSKEVSDWMTAISKTLPPPPRLTLDRDKSCSVTLIRNHGQFSTGYTDCSNLAHPSPMDAPRRQSFHSDHTVPPGVVIDWGRGWGWGEASWAAQLACGHDASIGSALYCSNLEDYSLGGYEDTFILFYAIKNRRKINKTRSIGAFIYHKAMN